MSLKQKTVKGLFWSFLDSFGIYFIKFGFTIAIARALSPSDYGLIGMITIFIAIADMLIESGFSMALIQKKDTNDTDLSTVFWFNVLVALLIYFILFFAAPLIADFFTEPILIKITRISALNVILASLRIVQLTILSKKLNFRKQTLINFAAAATSGVTGVVLAYKGYAVWALVIQTLAGSIISTIGFWISNKWWPKLIFSYKSFKSMFSYGSNILFQGAISVIFEKLYFPLIGKYFSAGSLGFYTYANRFHKLFIRNSAIAYGRVTFPAFSSIQHDKERFNRNYLKSYRLLAIAMFPLSLFLILSAKPFVIFFLTEKWLPSVLLMQVFFIEGFFFPFYSLNQNILCATGESGLVFKIDLVKKSLAFSSIFIFLKYGIIYLIIGQVISTFIAYLISNHFTIKKIQINIFELSSYLARLCLYVGISVIPYLLTFYFNNNRFLILLSIMIGFFLYFLCIKIFCKKEIYEVKEIIINMSNKKK